MQSSLKRNTSLNNNSNKGGDNKGLYLQKRLKYIFSEYERIYKFYLIIANLKNFSNNESQKYFTENLINSINLSSQDLINLYECDNNSILEVTKLISSFAGTINNSSKLENSSISLSSIKLVSKGWSGSVAVLGDVNLLENIGNKLHKYFESQFNGNNKLKLTEYWISDDLYNYCYWSKVGGKVEILDPKYEDFMMSNIADNDEMQSIAEGNYHNLEKLKLEENKQESSNEIDNSNN